MQRYYKENTWFVNQQHCMRLSYTMVTIILCISKIGPTRLEPQAVVFLLHFFGRFYDTFNNFSCAI